MGISWLFARCRGDRLRKSSYHPLLIAVTLYIAAVAQVSIAPAIAPVGFTPDFLLLALALFAMKSKPLGGIIIGFFAGLLFGAIAGANLQTYILSRVIAGFIISWLCSLDLDPSIILAILVSVLAVIVGQAVLIFVAAPPNVGGLIEATIETAVYNGVLAIPVYALLKKIQAPAVQ